MRRVWIASALLTWQALACSQSHRAGEPPARADAATPAAEPDRDPPPSAGAAGRDEPTQAANDALADQLLGDWSVLVASGRVYELRDWYAFEPDGVVRNRIVNHGGSAGIAFGPTQLGHYELRDRELLVTVELQDFAGSAAGELPLPPAQRGTRTERMSLAMGTRPTGDPLAGQSYLDAKALFADGDRRFGSDYALETVDGSGATSSRYHVRLDLQLNRGLRGLAAGSALDVRVRAHVAFVAPDMPGDEDALELAYRAVLRAEDGWLRIVPEQLDGLAPIGAEAEFKNMLSAAGVERHPAWARAAFERELFPLQRYLPSDPSRLTSSELVRSLWTRFDGSNVFTERR